MPASLDLAALPLTLILLAVLIPVAALFARLLGRNAGWALGIGYLVAGALLLPAARTVVTGSGDPAATRWSVPWVPGYDIGLAFRLDGLGVVFAYIALLIGAAVLFYSTRYFERRETSFEVLMAVFTFAMVGLVLADDIFVLFICWELTSLASFFLIARSGPTARAPSLRTLFLTFIGGLALLVAVCLIAALTGTTSVAEVLASPAWAQHPGLASGAAALVAVAALTKSAQFPFHSWLPDAMAASTPVSAYLHAAAVVKAGIFLLLRFSPAFAGLPVWSALLLSAGLVTAFVGGWGALTQSDLKKLMAYSTVSQLGLIVAAIGTGTELGLIAAIVHVVAHALFKSGLFMMVGVVDHLGHTREFGSIPRLIRAAPASFAITALGAASMAGVPPLLGFASKEMIFTGLLEAGAGDAAATAGGWLLMLAAAGASVLTVVYCVRIVFGAFIDGPVPGDQAQLPPADRLGHEDPIMVVCAAAPIVASVPLAFLLDPFAAIADPALAAVMGEPEAHAHLALFHGLNAELAASAVLLAVGAVLCASRRLRTAVFAFFARAQFPVSGAQVLGGEAKGLAVAGRAMDRALGTERSAPHVAANLSLLTAVMGGGILAILAGPGLPPAVQGLSRPIDGVLLALIAFAVLAVCLSRSRLTAVVALSAVGILATVQIMALGAPDVTLTQLLVEAMTIIVFMLVLQKLPRTFWRYPKAGQVRRAVFALAVGAAMGGTVWAVSGRRGRSDLAMYYLDHAPQISGGKNIVNTILVEFRALDTLGELSVLGMAGIAIVAVMSSVRDRYIDPPASQVREVPHRPWLGLRPPGTSAYRAVTQSWPNVVALQLMVRVVGPLLAIVSAVVFWRGHNEPGGGFIAALIGSAIVGLLYMSTSKDRPIGPPRAPLYLIGGGIGLAVLTGLLGLVLTGSFLGPKHAEFLHQHWTTSMIFDAGVYMAVLGLILVSFNLLGTSDSAFTPAGDDVLQDGRMQRDVPSIPRTRERTDEMLYGELPGPLDLTRGQRPGRAGPAARAEHEPTRLSMTSRHTSRGEQPKERGE